MKDQSLFTIAPHAPFLATLAAKVLDGTLLSGWERTSPFWLSDVTIFLPTKRARFALAECFAQRLGGAALLPDIRVLGAQEEEEEPFLPPIDAPILPPAVNNTRRLLILGELIERWIETEMRRLSPHRYAGPWAPSRTVDAPRTVDAA